MKSPSFNTSSISLSSRILLSSWPSGNKDLSNGDRILSLSLSNSVSSGLCVGDELDFGVSLVLDILNSELDDIPETLPVISRCKCSGLVQQQNQLECT